MKTRVCLKYLVHDCSRNTSNLMTSQKINVIGSFYYISYRLKSFGTLVMKGDSFFFPFSFELCPIDGRPRQFGAF